MGRVEGLFLTVSFLRPLKLWEGGFPALLPRGGMVVHKGNLAPQKHCAEKLRCAVYGHAARGDGRQVQLSVSFSDMCQLM